MSSTFRRRGLNSLDSSLQYHLLLVGLNSIPCFLGVLTIVHENNPGNISRFEGQRTIKSTIVNILPVVLTRTCW